MSMCAIHITYRGPAGALIVAKVNVDELQGGWKLAAAYLAAKKENK